MDRHEVLISAREEKSFSTWTWGKSRAVHTYAVWGGGGKRCSHVTRPWVERRGGRMNFEQVSSAYLSHSLRTAQTAAGEGEDCVRTWVGFITALWGRWISSSPSKTGARRKSKPNAIHITPGLVKLSVRMFLNSPSMHAMTRRSFPIAWAPKLEIRRGGSLRGREIYAVSRLPSFFSFCRALLAGVGLGGREPETGQGWIENRGGREGVPEPSWCRAEHVCGCGGTWGRYP